MGVKVEGGGGGVELEVGFVLVGRSSKGKQASLEKPDLLLTDARRQ